MQRSLISQYIDRPASAQPDAASLSVDTKKRAHPWRIRTTLALLVAACILPGTLISATFTLADYRRQREQAILDAVTTARGLSSALDRDLASTESGLYVLATSNILVSDNLQSFYERAKAALPYQNVSNYVLLDSQGRQLLNTLKPWGTPLPKQGGPKQLLRTFETGQATLTDLFTGPVIGKPILALGVPVTRQGVVTYCLAAGIFPERMSNLLRSQHLPKDWIGAILDGQGVLAARTHEPDRFVGKSAVPDLVRMAQQTEEGRIETVSLEGIPVVTVFSRSKLSKWTVAIGIPKASLVSGVQQSFMQLMAFNTLLIAGGMLIAWRVAMSRVANPANRLLERMHRMAEGHNPGPQVTEGASLEFVALESGFERMRESLAQRDQERDALVLRLTQTLESINDGFYLLDAQWRFAYVNQHAARMLGCDQASLLGLNHWSVLDADESSGMKQAYEQAIRTRQPVSFETQWPSLGLWLEVNAYPSDHGLSVYFRDVTAVRQAQQAHEAQLVAEAANQAKTEFVSRMSHELRTPLNAVIGFAQILRMDVSNPLNERQLSVIEHIEVAGQHMRDMIHDLLDLSSLEAGAIKAKIQSVDVKNTVETCCQMMSAVATAAGITIQCTCESDVSFVRADPTRLKQVLLNLISNAIKYNRAGGYVTVTAKTEGHGTRISVKDDGMGMTPAQQSHLFEPFNRLGREQGGIPGSGIGLIICKKLIELMGGDLTVSSQDRVGSVFSFNLPNVSAPAEALSVVKQREDAPQAYGRRKVLCVEDNPINCALMEATLAHRPQLEVTFAHTVAQANAHLDSNPVDLILLDMHLPDGTGMDVLARLRRQGPHDIPVLMVSADVTEECSRVAMEAGVQGYLSKPIDVEKTLRAIDTLFKTPTRDEAVMEAERSA